MANYSLYDQYKSTFPDTTEEGFGSVMGKIKEQVPDATDDELQTVFETVAAVTGQGELTPRGAAYADLAEEKAAQRVSRGVPAYPTQPPEGPVPAYQPAAMPAPAVEPTRNRTGEAIGGFFSALGGPAVAQQYQSGIELKDRQDNAVAEARAAEETMKQTRAEWAQKKRESDAKFKESQDQSDPNSDVSKVAREAAKRLAGQDPQLGEMLSKMNIGNMSATQLAKIMPFLDKIVDNTTQQIKLQHKKELDDANNEYKQKLLDAKIETIKVGRSGGGGGGRSYSGGGAPATSTEVAPDGMPKITGIKVDRQGNRSIDPIVARELTEKQKAAELAAQFMKSIPAIEAILPETSQSGVGEFIGKAQTFIGAGKTGAANKKMEQFANAALGALNSPLMKGAPSEADARRALSIINDPTAPLSVKQDAVVLFKDSLQNAIDTHNSAVAQYDAETIGKLKGVGVNTVVSTLPKAATPAPKPTAAPTQVRKYNPATGKLE